MEELVRIVSEMKIKDNRDKDKILEKIKKQKTLTGKCIMARAYLSPQSTEMEKICKNDLQIENALNETSGDGCKNGKNYEIKTSIYANKSKINFVQIRPDHNIDYYIFIEYNMYENETIGKGYIFKIPAEKIYELIIDYGGYAHGTSDVLGKITNNNMKGRNYEYALRCNPNAKNSKNFKLWCELLKYEVDYHPDNF